MLQNLLSNPINETSQENRGVDKNVKREGPSSLRMAKVVDNQGQVIHRALHRVDFNRETVPLSVQIRRNSDQYRYDRCYHTDHKF